NFISRPRFSALTYAGSKKITRLAPRSVIVAFSADAVYAIAELIRRQRGGAAVVLGALSPRTRNAQVALYQAGEVEFLVATDAIGMGLNMDIDHVAFSGVRKFDGAQNRDLTAAELAQIAGRAGRHMNDGTFGVTGECQQLDEQTVQRIEAHRFDSVQALYWRNNDLDYATPTSLIASLTLAPVLANLVRGGQSSDQQTLEYLLSRGDLADISGPAAVKQLWETCQIPDYRKLGASEHAALVLRIYRSLMSDEGTINEDWLAEQVSQSDRTDGDIDTLATRISHIRTWTFVANKGHWLSDAEHWRDKTRAVEDRLSDALHERLTKRFIDRRTSVLMKKLKDKQHIETDITDTGDIVAEG
ncbi:MAG: helicase-related protein, partial [Hyphomicrobiales bacterium]